MNTTKLHWRKDAELRLKKAPFFVRRIARRKIETQAIEQGIDIITCDFVDQVKAKQKQHQ